jgi:uncharacterized protein
MTTVGLISDTHGLLRPEAVQALAGVNRILHAGDVGRIEVLAELRAIAPVTVVRGNIDQGPCGMLPFSETVEIEDARIYIIHDLDDVEMDPAGAGINAVVSGHSHKPLVKEVRGVLYVNPGSAGPRRFQLPISVGRLLVDGGRVQAELITL